MNERLLDICIGGATTFKRTQISSRHKTASIRSHILYPTDSPNHHPLNLNYS